MTPRSGVRVAREICVAGGAGRRDIQGLTWGWRRGGTVGWDWEGKEGRGRVVEGRGRVVDGRGWKKQAL